jgi:hypothetical protein
MTKASDNLFPGIILQEAANDGSDFSNPAADYRRVFLGEDGELHAKDSSGTVTDLGGSGSTSGTTIVHHTYTRTSANYTTSSATLVAVDATANTMSKDVTVAANSRLRVTVLGTIVSDGTNSSTFAIGLDGTTQGGTSGQLGAVVTTSIRDLSFSWISGQLSADTYTVALYWRTASGVLTLRGDSSLSAYFAIEEILA